MKRSKNQVTDIIVRGISRELLDAFDQAIRSEYASRSEAIRDYMARVVRGEFSRFRNEPRREIPKP